jgi:hypothetical protein
LKHLAHPSITIIIGIPFQFPQGLNCLLFNLLHFGDIGGTISETLGDLEDYMVHFFQLTRDHLHDSNHKLIVLQFMATHTGIVTIGRATTWPSLAFVMSWSSTATSGGTAATLYTAAELLLPLP